MLTQALGIQPLSVLNVMLESIGMEMYAIEIHTLNQVNLSYGST